MTPHKNHEAIQIHHSTLELFFLSLLFLEFEKWRAIRASVGGVGGVLAWGGLGGVLAWVTS